MSLELHYNIYLEYFGFGDLSSLKLGKNLYNLRYQSQEKLFIFISNNTEYYNENWTMKGLIEFFNEYRKIYPFNWINYTINDLVVIWEIDYIDKDF